MTLNVNSADSIKIPILLNTNVHVYTQFSTQTSLFIPHALHVVW